MNPFTQWTVEWSRLRHLLAHRMGWNHVFVISEWRGAEMNDPQLWMGCQCVACGKQYGWHRSRVQ